MTPDFFMVFDVESIGLHGEGFACGYVVIDPDGNELEARRIVCPSEKASGDDESRAWVAAHCPKLEQENIDPFGGPCNVRGGFWWAWRRWQRKGAVLVADCGWPVEARFLAACVDDLTFEGIYGPYPLHEVATMRIAAGLDPLATDERLPGELPAHDPIADARQSARLWIEAMKMIERRGRGTP